MGEIQTNKHKTSLIFDAHKTKLGVNQLEHKENIFIQFVQYQRKNYLCLLFTDFLPQQMLY